MLQKQIILSFPNIHYGFLCSELFQRKKKKRKKSQKVKRIKIFGNPQVFIHKEVTCTF